MNLVSFQAWIIITKQLDAASVPSRSSEETCKLEKLEPTLALWSEVASIHDTVQVHIFWSLCARVLVQLDFLLI